MYSASGFRITAPAQSHVTDALVYTAPPTAPAPHITAPAQPHETDAVAMALFLLGVMRVGWLVGPVFVFWPFFGLETSYEIHN